MTRFWKIFWGVAATLLLIVVLIIHGCGKKASPPPPPPPATTQSSAPQKDDSLVKALAAAQQVASDAQATAKAALQMAGTCSKCGTPGPRHAGNTRPKANLDVTAQQPVKGAPQTEAAQVVQTVAQTTPPASQPSDERKYATRDEVRDMLESAKADFRASIPKPLPPAPPSEPKTIAVTVNAPTPTLPPPTPIIPRCLKQKKDGGCKKMQTLAEAEKEARKHCAINDSACRNAVATEGIQGSVHHLVVEGAVADTFLGVIAGGTVAEAVKAGDPTATANAQAAATASSVAEALARKAAAAKAAANGFGSLKVIPATAGQ